MSPSTLIIGGSGKCARHITRLLTTTVSPAHTVHSIIRDPSQADSIAALGARPIIQNIETASTAELENTIRDTGASTILFCAGAGGKGGAERTRAVDYAGAVKCYDAAAATGKAAGEKKRVIVISALDVRLREGRPEPEWYNDADRERTAKVWGAIGHYMEAKLAADTSLVSENERRGLEWTIVRPGGLNDQPATGKIAAGKVHLYPTVSREDVAAVVVECIRQEGTKGLAFDVVGGETPIGEAVAEVARERIDTFAGRY